MSNISIVCRVFLIGLCVLPIACKSAPTLTDPAMHVQILTGACEAADYRVVDIQSARYDTSDGGATACMTELRNIAASQGADAVRVISASMSTYGVSSVTAEILVRRSE